MAPLLSFVGTMAAPHARQKQPCGCTMLPTRVWHTVNELVVVTPNSALNTLYELRGVQRTLGWPPGSYQTAHPSV